MWALTESGATALGPALVLALGVARNGGLGSCVTLCTDGLANVGLGALDAESAGGVDAVRAARLFYVEQAEQAKLAKVAVSFVSLIGAECKLEALAVVADESGGTIERINALQLLEPDAL